MRIEFLFAETINYVVTNSLYFLIKQSLKGKDIFQALRNAVANTSRADFMFDIDVYGKNAGHFVGLLLFCFQWLPSLPSSLLVLFDQHFILDLYSELQNKATFLMFGLYVMLILIIKKLRSVRVSSTYFE